MSMRQQVIDAGLHANYFHVMKIQQKPKYDYLCTLHKDLIEADRIYKNQVHELRERLTTIYYELAETRKWADFTRYCGIYKNSQSIYSIVNNAIFRSHEKQMRFDSFQTLSKLAEKYDEYKRISDIPTL